MDKNVIPLQNSEHFLFPVKILGCFSDDELDALCGYIPMTEKIFDNCLHIFYLYDDVDGFSELIDAFPEFSKKYHFSAKAGG